MSFFTFRNSRHDTWRQARLRRSHRIESLEPRIALHAGEDHGNEDDDHEEEEEHDDGGDHGGEDDHGHPGESGGWLSHFDYDSQIVNALAAGIPEPEVVVAAVAPGTPPSEVGEWGPLENWQIEFINAVLLPTGKVLGYDRTLNLRIWDPQTGLYTEPAYPGYNIFCTGTAMLADGSILVTGGHVVDSVGLPFAAIYNAFEDSWTQVQNINAGRWYPSSTTLATGEVLILSGDTNGPRTDPLPQVYDPETQTWRDLTTALQTMSFYPRTFSAPNGQAFVAGPDPLSQYLDTTGTGAWTPVDYRVQPNRSFGSAVMYAPGKILYVGGGAPASNTAEVIDLNDPNPEWRLVAPMEFARRNCNATLLPDGRVLITGGNTGSLNYDGDAILAAEIWDPVTETFTTVADESDIRWYHSTALLLPDGRVLSTSGDLHITGQVYSPPYLFQGTRPTITSAPETALFDQNIFVGTPDAAQITSVRWIRLGSATHAQNWDQYIFDAAFAPAPGGLVIEAPTTPTTTPPGYYMLFINKGDVPSEARMIRVGTPPTLSVEDAEGQEGTSGQVVFTVSLDLASSQTITVNYTTADGAATAGSDYAATAGTLTFAPGEKTKTVAVPLLGPDALEPNETFSLILSDALNAAIDETTAQGLIRDATTTPVIEIEGDSLVEGNAGTTTATFTVRLSSPSASTVTVSYTTVDGTAKAGSDYVAKTGLVTFAAGVTEQTITVLVNGDPTDEYNETFIVRLSAPSGATLEETDGQYLIYNDDAPVTANLVDPAVVIEPGPGGTTNAVVAVALSAVSGKDVVVRWTTGTDGPARPHVNFTPSVGRVVIPAGQTTGTLTVPVLNDGVKRPNMYFSVQMQSELENANYGNRYTGVQLINTDTIPEITITKVAVGESNGGLMPMVFMATLSEPMAETVTVAYATSAGTATAGVDYTNVSGTLIFLPGVTSRPITVLVNGDTTPESSETILVTLSNPTNAVLHSPTAVGVIVDDDGAPVPAAPTNLTAIPGYRAVQLDWTAVAGATSYRVYRGTHPGGEGVAPIATGLTTTTFTDNGLDNDTTYYYWVTAAATVGGPTYEGQSSAELAIKPTAYSFYPNFLDDNLPNFHDSESVLSLNGINVYSVHFYENSLHLTDGGTSQTNSAFTRLPVSVTAFTTEFVISQTASVNYDDPIADGMTFAIQGVGPTAMGVSGGGLGYADIPNSVAVKFDLFDGAGEGFNSTGLYTDGAMPEAAGSIDLEGTGIDLQSGHPLRVNMVYNGVTLQVTLTDTVTLATATQTYTVDIPEIVGGDMAYVGFTAGSGWFGAVQQVHSWVYTPTPPAPAAPSGLEVTATAATSVALGWTNNAVGASSILIERKTGAAGTWAQIAATASGTTTTYTDTTVAPATTYFYRVRAVVAGVNSPYSNEISATTSSAATPILDFSAGFAGAASQLKLNGASAAIAGTALQLTTGAVIQAASAFSLTPVSVASFSTQFTFQLQGGTTPIADGITFTIQGGGNAALGGTGGALGFAGLPQSVAVKFDVFSNTGEGPNSTGLFLNGVQPNSVGSISLAGTGIDLHSGHPFQVNMSYDGTTLQVTIVDSVTQAAATQTYTVDIPAIVGGDTAYVGFTGATGGLTAVQRILNWTYSTAVTPPPAPAAPSGLEVTATTATSVALGWTNNAVGASSILIERKTGAAGTWAQIAATASGTTTTYTDTTVAPATTYFYRVRAVVAGVNSPYSNEISATTSSAATPILDFSAGFAGAASQLKLNGASAAIAGTALQLTTGAVIQAASAFSLTPVSVASFSTQFTFQLQGGTTPIADGITFTIQGVGNAALGGTGGALGFAGLPQSVAVKFDVFSNTGEGPNSTGLFLNGVQPNSVGSISLAGTGIDLHSGHPFQVNMSYDGTTLQVTIVDSVTQAAATQTYTVDIPAIVGGDTAYVGFTGATGGLTAVQRILNWTYSAPAEQTSSLVVAALESTSILAAAAAQPTDPTTIARIYREFLGRDPDAFGLAQWTQLHARGATYGDIAAAIFDSDEAVDYRIQEQFALYLERASEPWGIELWRPVYRTQGEAAVTAGIAASDEAFQLAGSSNTAWLKDLYWTALGRAPDSYGLNLWKAELASGRMTRFDVAHGFASSFEYLDHEIGMLYESLIGRDTTTRERNTVPESIQRGRPLSDVILNVIDSDEFL